MTASPIYTEEFENGNIGHIYFDDPQAVFNPRTDCDHLGTMVCFHNRYKLGDNHKYDLPTRISLEDQIVKDHGPFIALPLYLYNHSGLTMNTTGFSCPWDSGQVGVIFVSTNRAREYYGWKKLSAKRRKTITDHLRAEVEEYDSYLRGECYGYVVTDANGIELDSCWGFLGDVERCKEEMRSHAKNY